MNYEYNDRMVLYDFMSYNGTYLLIEALYAKRIDLFKFLLYDGCYKLYGYCKALHEYADAITIYNYDDWYEVTNDRYWGTDTTYLKEFHHVLLEYLA